MTVTERFSTMPSVRMCDLPFETVTAPDQSNGARQHTVVSSNADVEMSVGLEEA